MSERFVSGVTAKIALYVYKYSSFPFLIGDGCCCYFLASVAIICHSTVSIMQRLLFRAQDRNMTNGDYAFFTFSSLYAASSTEKPWALYDMQNEDVEQRLKAFYSLKQVQKWLQKMRIFVKKMSIVVTVIYTEIFTAGC